MIALYYTNANTPGAKQPNPKASIGGYRSGTRVPNGRKGSIFGDLAAEALQSGHRAAVALMATNLSENPLTSVEVSLEAPTVIGGVDYSLALVSVVDDSVEQLGSSADLPYVGDFLRYGVDFQPAERLPVLAELQPGASLGVWLVREVTPRPSLVEDAALVHDVNLAFHWA